MVYATLRAPDLFELAYTERFYPLSSINRLIAVLNRGDFSVISTRREMHTAVSDFETSGIEGARLFSDLVRFPDGLGEVYICSADGNVQNWFAAMTGVLSHRPTNVAKDTDAGNGSRTDRVFLSQDAAEQDAFKQFVELKKVLSSIKASPYYHWNRRRFEDYVSGPWT